MNQGRNEQVHRVRLSDGRRLRGAHFPRIYCFIPINREYLAQLSVRSTGIFCVGTKSFRGRQNGYKGRGAILTFGGGKKIGSKKAPGGATSL